MSPVTKKTFRTAAMKCMGLTGTRASTATTIAWSLGEHCDPAVRIPVAQAQMWIELWRQASDAERGHIKEAWHVALKHVMARGTHWQKVAGPVSATITEMAELRWKPILPDSWKKPDLTVVVVASDEAGPRQQTRKRRLEERPKPCEAGR